MLAPWYPVRLAHRWARLRARTLQREAAQRERMTLQRYYVFPIVTITPFRRRPLVDRQEAIYNHLEPTDQTVKLMNATFRARRTPVDRALYELEEASETWSPYIPGIPVPFSRTDLAVWICGTKDFSESDWQEFLAQAIVFRIIVRDGEEGWYRFED